MSKSAEFLAKKRELLDHLKKLMEEKAVLIATLEMWQDLEEQGIEPETVSHLGFNPDKLHRCPLRRHWQVAPQRHAEGLFWQKNADGSQAARWYNIVVLKDGTEIVLPDAILTPEERVKNMLNKELGKCQTPIPSSPVGPGELPSVSPSTKPESATC